MHPGRIPTTAKALALALVTSIVVACLAPLIGEPVEERSALWVVTDRALVRVGLDGDGTHRSTDPVPGATTAEVRVRGDRIVTARDDAVTSHALTDTLQLDDGVTLAMDAAGVSGLAVSRDTEHIWLARPAPEYPAAHAGHETGSGESSTTNGNQPANARPGFRPGHGFGHSTRITALSQDLVPAWQQEIDGRVVALAAAPQDQIDTSVWVLQDSKLLGLDETGTTITEIALPHGPKSKAFAPLTGERFAVANLLRVYIVDIAGNVLHQRRQIATRNLHTAGEDRLWAVGLHRLTLLDEQLGTLQSYHLPAQGIGAPITAATADPRDGSLWFVAGRSLYQALPDGRLEEYRDLFAYLGTDPVTDVALYADTFAPELTVEEPEGRLVTSNDRPNLVLGYSDTGIGVDTDTLAVELDGELADGTCQTDAEEQRIDCVIGPLDDGTHTVSATVADYAGNESEPVEAIFEIDSTPPEISIDAPVDGAFVNTENVTIRGELSETAELSIDGEAVGLDIDDRFEHAVPLTSDGPQTIELRAEDGAGNTATRTITVTRDTIAPPTIVTDGITVEAGATEGTVRVRGADGSAESDAEVVITNTRTGEGVTVSANSNGAFVAEIAGEIGDRFEIRVRDRAGNESDPTGIDSGSGGGEIPPDPEDIAPPLPETGIPPFDQQIDFLYEGANSIQQGVDPGTIEARRVSVLRGEVRNRAGDPIPGVEISILNHPELGTTHTQADGGFDMAVNGGGQLTVEYRKEGLLPVQRTIQTQWNGWYHAEGVVMIPLDDKVTTIDLTDDSQPFQVARGSVVTDSDGTRQATLLFPAGTTAEITLPDGTKQHLSQLDVRATEYTVGNSGPAAMPGKLPPASAYTYAVELSVDQALEQGVKAQGKDVTFNQPVPLYVDNFLDFPVGEAVPVGYYNNDTAAWVPHDNGRIVGILDAQNALAILDVTGDGEPATQAELDELNITDAERARLVELYAPGDSLWRFVTTHLSTWDCNWPYGPPDDASPPLTPLPETGDEYEPEDSDEEDECEGCSISPQKQSLGESIDIAGTPYSLHYQSERAKGARDNTVTIPLTSDEIPDSLEKVKLEITIAGRIETHEFPAEPNQIYEFAWNGIDGFDRQVHSSETARVELSYIYPCQYLGGADGSSGGSAFGQFAGSVSPIGVGNRCMSFEFQRTSEIVLDSPFVGNRAAGSWTLSVEHTWHAGTSTLIKGDGTQRNIASSTLERVAGNGGENYFPGEIDATKNGLQVAGVETDPDGNIFVPGRAQHRVFMINPEGQLSVVAGNGERGFSGDGGQATKAQLDFPEDVAIGPGGSLYILDSNRVRRVGPDGIITTVAGTGEYGFGGDGGPATEALFRSPNGLDVDGDGTLYISDSGNHRIRRISSSGQIDSIAGSGPVGWGNGAYAGDGGPARQAGFESIGALALDNTGRILVADNSRIRRIDNDGTITTIAGTGERCFSSTPSCGDGGPAFVAKIANPDDLAVDRHGRIYIADQSINRVRMIDTGGIIKTVAGDGSPYWTASWPYGVGGDPRSAQITFPQGVAMDGAGDLIIADNGTNRVLKVRFGIEPLTSGNVGIPSNNQESYYVFDSIGQHVKTFDAITGEPRYRFGRDSDGRLATISDIDGNVTTVERDFAGTATAIVAPHGQRTELTVDDNGHLAALTNPIGEMWSMIYTDGGFLTRIEKPGAAVNIFSYDGNGRLVEDLDPKGGGWQLSRTVLTKGYRTDMISAEGRVHRFTTEHPDDFTRVYTNEAPNGTITTRTDTDTATAIERANGTLITAEERPDPRFTMGAPYVAERSIGMPSGITFQQSTDRSTVLSDPADPLSLDSLTETVNTNGRRWSASYDGADRTWTFTSPLGRVSRTVIDAQSRPSQQIVPDLEPVSTAYDDRGRLSTIEQGSGADKRTTAFAYHESGQQAGYLESVTDALGRTVSLETDAVGRVTEQTMPDGRVIGYQYDGRGNLVALSPPGRDAHVFQYDGLDQQLDYTPPDLAGTETVTRYTYNLDRQLRQIKRPGGEIITFDYDSGGRLSARRMPVGDSTYGYDATTGQVVSIDAPGGVGLQFQWDGFLPVRTDWTGPISGNVSRTFDSNFWVTQESVNGNPIAFGYDDDGLLINAGTLNVARDPDNGLITGTTQADVVGIRAHNTFGELADRAVTADGTTVYDVKYKRDKLGRIVEKTESLGGETHMYEYNYDTAGRLVEVRRDGTPVHLYDYDTNGNRTSHTGPAGTRTGIYDAQDRITAYGDATYTHTPAGERTSKTTAQGTATYDYDAAGNLREVGLPDGTTIEYLIDGRDRRVGKLIDGELQKGWLYRDQLNPVAEVDEAGTITARFVYVDKTNVPVYMVKNGTTYRIVSDHLGSVRLVINTETREIVQRMDYSPFGEVITDTNPGFQPFGFAGGLYDADTGLVRFGARDYDPEIGRWTAKDPIGFAGGTTNLYGYAINDPVNFVDPNGLRGFFANVAKNFSDTNSAIPGLALPTGTGIATAGVTARSIGGITFAGTLAFAGTSRFGGALLFAGVTSAVNTVIITGAFEAGVLVGSAINAIPTGPCGRTLRDSIGDVVDSALR